MQYSRTISDNILDCFQAQFPETALSDALAFLKSEKGRLDYNYFSFSIQIPKVDNLAVLEQNSKKNSFQYYWEKPIDDFSIIASGAVHRIQTEGKNRFKDASNKGKELLSQVYHLTNVRHHLASVHLLGGFSFFDESKSKEWKDFGAGSFTL